MVPSPHPLLSRNIYSTHCPTNPIQLHIRTSISAQVSTIGLYLRDLLNKITVLKLSADHISSAATGHQRSERRVNQKNYWESRNEKLAQQRPEKPSGSEANVLRNVRVYINGYLDGTTDIEMKRIVTLAGGQIQ